MSQKIQTLQALLKQTKSEYFSLEKTLNELNEHIIYYSKKRQEIWNNLASKQRIFEQYANEYNLEIYKATGRKVPELDLNSDLDNLSITNRENLSTIDGVNHDNTFIITLVYTNSMGEKFRETETSATPERVAELIEEPIELYTEHLNDNEKQKIQNSLKEYLEPAKQVANLANNERTKSQTTLNT